MNTNTTAPATGANTEAIPPVTVSMHKLVEGVGTVFAGVIQMLEALDPQTAAHVTGFALQNVSVPDAPGELEPKNTADAGKEEKDATEESAAAADTAAVPVPSVSADDADVPDQPAGVKVEPVSEQTADAAQNARQQEQPTPGVTLDDITKIIVGKIKQNPGNNEKIHALVKAHGAERVRDLPVSKYEAFLTDLSQI